MPVRNELVRKKGAQVRKVKNFPGKAGSITNSHATGKVTGKSPYWDNTYVGDLAGIPIVKAWKVDAEGKFVEVFATGLTWYDECP